MITKVEKKRRKGMIGREGRVIRRTCVRVGQTGATPSFGSELTWS